jgi:uncharacterized protein YndB with AHSA1/START domain
MTAIHHLFHIQKPIEHVFQAISASDKLSQWYTRTESFKASKDETFKMHFGEMSFEFQVQEIIENKRVVWKCIEADIPLEGHVMTYELDENDGKTRVRFSHEGFDEADDFMANLNFSSAKYLESLRQFCQTGHGEAFGTDGYRS